MKKRRVNMPKEGRKEGRKEEEGPKILMGQSIFFSACGEASRSWNATLLFFFFFLFKLVLKNKKMGYSVLLIFKLWLIFSSFHNSFPEMMSFPRVFFKHQKLLRTLAIVMVLTSCYMGHS